MVKDKKTGECFRLDHLIKNRLETLIKDKKQTPEVKEECKDIIIKLDGMTTEQMSDIVNKFNMKSPTTGNDLSEPVDFNLMFATQIGPTGDQKGFVVIAQKLNFKLLDLLLLTFLLILNIYC